MSDEFLSDFVEEDDGFLSDVKTNGESKEVEYKPEVHFHTSEGMKELDDNSVHLIVTSPPYNADWAYGSHDDNMDYQYEYLPMLARVFEECWRVLVPGGRMAINVPTLLRGGAKGGQAILSDIDTMINSKVDVFKASEGPETEDIRRVQEETNFVHREWITWNKGFNDDGMAPNGSYPRPWGILLNNMHEGISIYQKPGDRDVSTISEEIIEESKINKWSDDICDDVWDISPESWNFSYVDGEDVPPFPEELVKRCVTLWTYKGDTVLDPFAGRFTVGKVCKEMERHSVGYEIREELEEDINEYVRADQAVLGQW